MQGMEREGKGKEERIKDGESASEGKGKMKGVGAYTDVHKTCNAFNEHSIQPSVHLRHSQ